MQWLRSSRFRLSLSSIGATSEAPNAHSSAFVYFAYLPGFACFGSKLVFPSLAEIDSFGPHEAFHISVVLGHLSTMALDWAYFWGG